MEDKKRPIEEFNEHLDKCEVCKRNPFYLCPTGKLLLATVGWLGGFDEPKH